MIRPALQDEQFLDSVRSTREPALWWLGQSGFLLHCEGHYALLDPYLSDSLTRKYAQTPKPHVRMTERVIDPSRLDFIELVMSSHNHTDHLDAETLLPLRAANANLRMMIPEANRAFVAQRLGCDPTWPIGLDHGLSATAGPFTVTAIASAHERLDRDPQGRHPYLGYVVKFGRNSLYHSGDTVLYDGMVENLRPHAVGIALLPINGSKPERGVAGNLWGREAAWLSSQIGAKLTIPCHYDMFEFNTVTTEEFAVSAQTLGIEHRILRNGERLRIE